MKFTMALLLTLLLFPSLSFAGKFADNRAVEDEYEMGRMYYNGLGVPQDYAAAAQWFRKSADHGFAKAQAALGVMYMTGRGVEKDKDEGFRLVREAAAQGYAPAKSILENGPGQPLLKPSSP